MQKGGACMCVCVVFFNRMTVVSVGGDVGLMHYDVSIEKCVCSVCRCYLRV